MFWDILIWWYQQCWLLCLWCLWCYISGAFVPCMFLHVGALSMLVMLGDIARLDIFQGLFIVYVCWGGCWTACNVLLQSRCVLIFRQVRVCWPLSGFPVSVFVYPFLMTSYSNGWVRKPGSIFSVAREMFVRISGLLWQIWLQLCCLSWYVEFCSDVSEWR